MPIYQGTWRPLGHAALRRRQTYELETIATADDNQVADGKTILSFSQAQAKVRDLAKQFREAGPDATKFTLKEAIEAYLSGNRGRDQHTRLAMHVLKRYRLAESCDLDRIGARELA
jgi:ATP-dependent protease HslVU (ClpYQ) peptidase subunit